MQDTNTVGSTYKSITTTNTSETSVLILQADIQSKKQSKPIKENDKMNGLILFLSSYFIHNI